jgi:general stress protein 26
MTGTGKHFSRPMAAQEVDFDGDLWFFAYDNSDKVTQLQANPRVNVTLSNNKASEWTSISGTAEIVHDDAKAEQLWSAPLNTWFPDGLDTAGLTLIKVHADSAEYWASPNSNVVQLIGVARAIVTGNPDKFPCTNEEVSLKDDHA